MFVEGRFLNLVSEQKNQSTMKKSEVMFYTLIAICSPVIVHDHHDHNDETHAKDIIEMAHAPIGATGSTFYNHTLG